MTAAQSVRATLNYSVDNGRPPDYYFYEPDTPVELNPPGTDPHEVAIHNGWPSVASFSADREGFELKPFDNGFDQYDDDAAVHAGFYPQVVDYVKRQKVLLSMMDPLDLERGNVSFSPYSDTARAKM